MNNSLKNNSWLKLADYGDYPHEKGLQRLTPEAGQTIVKNFHSLASRLKRRFGGVPVFIGHPDDPAFKGQPGHTDTRAYAWIHNIEACDDGVWINPKWSKIGQEIKDNAHYKYLSPRWKLTQGEKGLSPIELISVALTNQPNIPGDTIANERKIEQKNIFEKNSSEKSNAKISSEESSKKEPASTTVSHNYYNDGLPLIASALGLSHDASSDDITLAIKNLRENTAEMVERTALINAQLDLALERGQIALQKRAEWFEKMSRDASDVASNELSAIPFRVAVMHTPFMSDRLTPFQESRVNARADFLRAVEKRMTESGASFSDAWKTIKEERKDIFLKM